MIAIDEVLRQSRCVYNCCCTEALRQPMQALQACLLPSIHNVGPTMKFRTNEALHVSS